MGAKIKGNPKHIVSDWLDDESDQRSRQKKKRKTTAKELEPPLPFQEANATVIEVFPKQCRVKMDETHHTPLCPYRRATVFHRETYGLKERTPVGVGDRVKVQAFSPQDGVVEAVCERKNYIYRAAPGKEGKQIHVIAANLDLIVIVASIHDPEFSHGLIDRFLVAAQRAKIPAIICINKTDLATKKETPWSIYQTLGVPCAPISCQKNVGIDALKTKLLGKRVAFAGHSGVGKTSLLRLLLGHEIGKIGVVNQNTSKGQHTTTSSIVYDGPESSEWIDTPGVRSFSLTGMELDELKNYFPEFLNIQCPNPNCMHNEEPDCKARSLPRYESYKRILDSLNEELDE